MTEVTSSLLLLVEDEDMIRHVVVDALQSGGYGVVESASGKNAMALLDEDASRFRAIITDIRLGAQPDGWKVARHARELNPAIAVVYITGDSAHEWSSQGVPNSLLVAKPFAAAQLVTAVSQLLVAADSQPAPEAPPQ
jgi:CheY-like chemotaxis protein